MQAHTVDNECRQQWLEWPFQLSELKFDSLLQLELLFVFAAICLQSENHVQRPVKCATGWSFVCAILLQSCKCAILQSHNRRAILQMCNRAILVQAEDLPSVSRLLLFKRATFCPTQPPACGYNSQLRGENEHLAWRQELVRMARSPSVDHDCHNCLKIATVPLRWWRHEAILPPSKTCYWCWGLVVGGSLVVWWGN